MSLWFAVAVAAALVAAPAAGNPPPSAADVLELPAELRSELDARFADHAAVDGEARLRRLVEFVFSPQGLALEYDDSQTRTVAETYRQHRGNCLSTTLLVIALADELGLDARAQEFEQVIDLYQQGNLLFNSTHISARVRVGHAWFTVDVDRTPRLSRTGPRRVTADRLLAHYYNNRGVELMSAGDLEGALAHLQAALASDAGFIDAWNNLGVLQMRRGQDREAEADYLHALSLDRRNTSALYNLMLFHERAGDPAGQAEFRARLAKVQMADPFHHFLLGLEAERRGDYAGAIDHYRRAIRLRGDEHLFHFGLARAYYLAGDNRRAAQALARAEDLSEGEARSRYQAKLDFLRER